MGLVADGMLYKEMISGKQNPGQRAQSGVKVLYAVGEIPLPKSGVRPDVDFLIVQNSHLTDLAEQADIVLPSTAFLESEGTIVDYLGRLKKAKKAIEPLGKSKTHGEIFIELAKVLRSKVKEPTKAEVKKAMRPKKVKPSIAPFKKQEGFDVDSQEMIESLNSSVINSSRLLWLKETERATPV
jgi:predicted molibdopterin-dependent oxidoreductase YjgC